MVTEQTASTYLITCGGGNWRVGLVWHRRLSCYLPAGGHVEADETPEAAAVREVHEETGIAVRRLVPGPAVPLPAGFSHPAVHAPWWTVVMNADPDNHTPAPHLHIDAVYVAIADSEIPETDAETTVYWFTADELHTTSDISDDARLQAQAILATIDQSDQVLLWPGQVFG